MSEYKTQEIMDKNHRCLGNRKRCGVYQITNIKNNKVYIGSSKSIWQRWKNHIRELDRNKHSNMFLQLDWNEYGRDSFVFQILEECCEDNRYVVEQKYLDELFPFYRSGNGYNISEKSTQRNETNVRLFKSQNGDNYYMVKSNGCKAYKMDIDHCNSTSREDLAEECFALYTYFCIRKNIIEQCGHDDWEW